MYTATLTVLGKTYSTKAKTPLEAIAALKPGNVRGRVILRVSNGNVSRERIVMPFVAMKLFNTAGLSRDIALKNLAMLFPADAEPEPKPKPKRKAVRKTKV